MSQSSVNSIDNTSSCTDNEPLKAKLDSLLESCYSLNASSLSPDFSESLIKESGGDPDFLNQLLKGYFISDERLLLSAILNSAKKINIPEVSHSFSLKLLSDVRLQIQKTFNSSDNINLPLFLKEKHSRIVDEGRMDRRLNKVRSRSRKSLLSEVKRGGYADLINSWDKNPHALSDKQMQSYFSQEPDVRFFTTYCDSAQFGMVNRFLLEEATSFSEEFSNLDDFVQASKDEVLRHFSPVNLFSGEPRRFSSDNVIFAQNGTHAFRLFYDHVLKSGNTLAVSSEEYSEITDMMESDEDGKAINLIRLPRFNGDVLAYQQALESVLSNSNIDYLFISMLSRRGTLFPMQAIRECIQKVSPSTKLIVDTCQVVGRRNIDFNGSDPDGFIASCQKGSDLGGPVGVLAFKDGFISADHPIHRAAEIGTLDKQDMARFVFALNPTKAYNKKAGLNKKLLSSMTMSVSEREKTLQDLSVKFLELLGAMDKNPNNLRKIEILYPSYIDSDFDVSDSKMLSGIFELKIEGLRRSDIIKICGSYGITIRDYLDEAEEDVSFRIALHPFMGNEAIQIICGALQKCASYRAYS